VLLEVDGINVSFSKKSEEREEALQWYRRIGYQEKTMGITSN
jgi:hypothetical protein